MAKSKQLEDFSTPIEEHISAPFIAVGSAEWLETAFEPGMLLDHEKIPVKKFSDLTTIKQFLIETPERAVDTETTGPKTNDDDKNYNMNPINEDTEMVVFQVGNRDITYLIQPKLLPHLKQEIELESATNILHNAIYDYKWTLVKYGIHLMNMHCTMLGEQVLTAGLSGYKVNLQDTVRRRRPYRLISKAIRSMFIEYAGYMTRDMAYYGARDCVLLFDVKDEQIALLEKQSLLETAMLEFGCIPATAELEITGVHLNTDILKIIIEYWLEQEKLNAEKILAIYDKEKKSQGKATNFLIEGLTETFDLNSNQDKLKALRELGFELDDVKRETLKEINHELAQLLATHSAITKKTSTYGQNILDKINTFSGLWHPRFNQLGSGDMENRKGKENKETIATGRMAGDAQQFPKPTDLYCIASPEEKALLRTMFPEKFETIS